MPQRTISYTFSLQIDSNCYKNNTNALAPALMVRLQLWIKAELENVTNLLPATDDHQFCFQVKCNSCHETHPNFVIFNRLEEHEVSGSKGNTAHFVWRCGFCKREHTAKFDTSFPPKPYTTESNGDFAPFLILDCRGLEFIGFEARGMWKCEGVESGTKFAEVDLDEGGEWTDYDEKAATSVSVMAVKGRWTRA